MQETKDQVLHIRLTQQELDRLERLARHTRRTRANAVRWLIATAPFGEDNVVIGKGGQGDANGN